MREWQEMEEVWRENAEWLWLALDELVTRQRTA